MKQVFKRPAVLRDEEFAYCPGCGHSLVHRLLAEVIDELGIAGRSIAVPATGCARLLPQYLDLDLGEAPRGLGLSVASGLKRLLGDHVVFAYQGEGDLAALGAGQALHAANQGEPITVIYVNNGLLAQSGGQMAPTTPPGTVTATTPRGREGATHGAPLDLSAALAQTAGSAYVARVALASPELIAQAKAALAKAFAVQIQGQGFSLVEVLAPCPEHLHLEPLEALAWSAGELAQRFPLGVLKDIPGNGEES